jgi:hypothetical protein
MTMSLQPQPPNAVPELTSALARTAFPKGNPYLKLRDELETIYADPLFVDLYPQRGQPAAARGGWRCNLRRI